MPQRDNERRRREEGLYVRIVTQSLITDLLKLHIGEERKRECTTKKEFARKLTLVFLLQFLVVFVAVADVYPVTTNACKKSTKKKKGTENASLTTFTSSKQ